MKAALYVIRILSTYLSISYNCLDKWSDALWSESPERVGHHQRNRFIKVEDSLASVGLPINQQQGFL